MTKPQPLPQATRDLEAAKADLETFGYCVVAEALDGEQVAALRRRLEEQAEAERQLGIAYRDGGANQEWGSFRDADGRPRADAFTERNGGVNQRLWMLVNKGREFRELLSHPFLRALVDHVLGDDYLLSSYIANIANPGGVAMKLHTDQWWMPVPTRRERKPLPSGSIARTRFDRDEAGPPSMIAPAVCCNIMWMLTDFTVENGGTRLVPRSHLIGRQPDSELDRDVETVAASGPAGTAVLFDGRTWHGTGANISNAPRLGLLTTFCAPQFRAHENFTIGTRLEILAEASDDLKSLLGFKPWGGYGRVDSPTVEFVDPAAPPLGELRPQ